MGKENVIYMHKENLKAFKKKEILSLATTWMKLEDIRLHEINQAQKDKYGMISCIGGIF
jgi:hypothetical protein